MVEAAFVHYHFKWASVKDQDSSIHWLLRVCWLLYCDKYRSNLLVSLDSRKKVTCSHSALIALRKVILPWQLWYVCINTHFLRFRAIFFSVTPQVFIRSTVLKASYTNALTLFSLQNSSSSYFIRKYGTIYCICWNMVWKLAFTWCVFPFNQQASLSAVCEDMKH